MNRKIVAIIVLICSTLCFCTRSKLSSSRKTEVNIIPKPQSLHIGEGFFKLTTSTVIICPSSKLLEKHVQDFAHQLASVSGIQLKPSNKKGTSNYITFEYNPQLNINEEGYEIIVSTKSISIKAKNEIGFYYAIQSLLQLLPAEIESQNKISHVKWEIPCVNIKDEPQFSWRGFHLDAGRHFMSVDFIKKHLDILSLYKINKFHWHLTEDQGWRIEIKKYPKLTSIGATRKEGDGSVYKGFYTQEQVKEIVAYAKERHIDVIPEIEMPGHALACLAAYPELSCTGGPFIPRNIWGVEKEVFCAGNDDTFIFLEHVLDEIFTLFPYEYIHIGGDECSKERWEECSKCKQRMSQEHLKNSHELQSYFIQRIEKYIQLHGKKMIGWDEILEGGLGRNATVMSWRGEEGGIEAANMNHDVIMSPSKMLYLNYYQGNRKVEPIANDYDTPCKTVYNYSPIPEKIKLSNAKNILGAQANLWTEYIYSDSMAEYQMYPRILALAELTWTSKENKNYINFRHRLNQHWKRLSYRDINYYIPQPEGCGSFVAFTDSTTLMFNTSDSVEKIVYTTDGSNPNSKSYIYRNPLLFKNSTVLKIASIVPGGKMSPVRTIQIQKETYRKAINTKNTKPGLFCKTIPGYYLNITDYKKSTRSPQLTVIDSISQANTTLSWGKDIDTINFKAVELSGYIDIPEDGIYFFYSDQDQVWIAEELIINNDGLVKRFSRNDGSIALTKGKHSLKIIYLNNIIGGWPSDWNTVELRYRNSKNNTYEIVSPEMCSFIE